MVYAQQEFMGWAADLSILLASIAVAVDGNPLNGKVSIGGPDSRVGTIPLLGGGTQIPGGKSSERGALDLLHQKAHFPVLLINRLYETQCIRD